MFRVAHLLCGGLIACLLLAFPGAAAGEFPGAAAGDTSGGAGGEVPGDAERGYRLLLDKPFLPPDFHQSAFDQIWTQWPEPLRSEAQQATPDQRRRMAFERYGLTARPGDDSGKPLQYVVDQEGYWTMNCLACHGGQVAGQVIPGLPNSRYALQTLTEEIRATKIELDQPLTRMDVGSLFMPLGRSNGTTNAVMFGVALLAARDAELNVVPNSPIPDMVHHDMAAPPWWHFNKKSFIYADGFIEKGHRALMQFLLVQENGPQKFREWEQDFRDVYAYLQSVEAPRYPFAIDQPLAERGRAVFNRSCAECHGTYGEQPSYPNRLVPIDVVETDPVRLEALSETQRARYAASWFAHYGEKETLLDPGGYVAPPLDGIWASAPYFHNGSVPTLWHVLHPEQRPVVWKRTAEGYDQEKVGLEFETFDRLPRDVDDFAELREYFNTRAFGKNAAGHRFPEALSDEEKRAVLEYLKTL